MNDDEMKELNKQNTGCILWGLLIIAVVIILLSSCESYRHKRWTDKGERRGYFTDSTITKSDTFIKVVIKLDTTVKIIKDTIYLIDSAKGGNDKSGIDTFKVNSKGVKGEIIVNWGDSTAKWNLSVEKENKEIKIKEKKDSTTNINKQTDNTRHVHPPKHKCKEMGWWDRNKFWIGIIIGFMTLWITDRVLTRLFGKLWVTH